MNMDKPIFCLFVAFCLTVLHMQASKAHPQCLDFRAPFKLTTGLSFCAQNYSEFGCCTLERDRQIANDYSALLSKFSLNSRSKCAGLVKDVLCLECHHYAAHIFEGEGNTKFDATAAAPGLCPNYCNSFYAECEDVAKYFLSTGRWELREISSPTMRRNTTVSPTSPPPLTRLSFCEGLLLKDTDYCYPDVGNIDRTILARKYNYDSNEGCLCVEEVARGLRNPLAAVHAGDGSHRLFIPEQLGVIRILSASGNLLQQPFLDLRDRVLSSDSYGDERGLLSIAFHPDFKKNRRFFVFYSTRIDRLAVGRKKKPPFYGLDHRTIVSEFKASYYNKNRGLRRSEKVILQIRQPRDNHNGGTLFFGSDGFLYLTIGDGGGAGDRFGKYGNSLNRSNLLGSIIRIDINARGYRYKVPSDNPFINTPGVRPEIFAYGTRNMWRCSVDRGDSKTGEGKGRIFCGDVGQNKYEEIDIIVKGGNYGWRALEGFQCFDSKLCNSPLVDDAIPPIFAYNHSIGKSVVGGYVYRGCQNPNLRGKYILGDTVTSRVFLLTEDKTTGNWKEKEVCFGDNKYCTNNLSGNFEQFVLSFGEDEGGELYILSTSPSRPTTDSRGGKVYRIVDPARRGDPTECFTYKNKTQPPANCKDHKGSASMCNFFKNLGKCEQYKTYFSKKCKKTCGFC